jgi:hypothetical protein
LLWATLRRVAGPAAGLLAGAVLTLTPALMAIGGFAGGDHRVWSERGVGCVTCAQCRVRSHMGRWRWAGQRAVSAAQRAQSRLGSRCSCGARSWPQRHVVAIGPRRGTVRAGRPARCASVTVGRPRRGRTEVVYRCMCSPDDAGREGAGGLTKPQSLPERNTFRRHLVTWVTKRRAGQTRSSPAG